MEMRNFVDVWEDGKFDDVAACVSYYPDFEEWESIGRLRMYEVSDLLEKQVKTNYPELTGAQFDPESEGFMVYCDSVDVAEVINEELNYLIEYLVG